MSASGNGDNATGGEWKEASVVQVPRVVNGHGPVAAEAERLGLQVDDEVIIYVVDSEPYEHLKVKGVREREVEPTAIPGVVGISPAAA